MDIEQAHADVTKMLLSNSFRKLLNERLLRIAFLGASAGMENSDFTTRRILAAWALYRGSPRDAIIETMEVHLDRPYCFTIDDLLDSINEHLLMMKHEGDELLLECPGDEKMGDFAERFRLKTLFPRSTAPSRLGEGKLDLETNSSREIWISQSGFAVELLNASVSAYDPLSSDVFQSISYTVTKSSEGEESESVDAEYPTKGADHILVRLSGNCTPRALEKSTSEIHTLLCSVWCSLEFLSYIKRKLSGIVLKRRGRTVVFGLPMSDPQIEIMNNGTPSDPEDQEWITDPKYLKGYEKVFGSTDSGRSSSWICSFLGRCLDYFYMKTGKKDTMERRLRNALCLIMEADRQESHAVHLSLCFAAIEALVCAGKEGIVDQLSRNVATLLQPDSNERRTAIKNVKKLYNLRSRVLHGSQVVIEAEIERLARQLAAGVLMAVMEWMQFVKKMGEENKPVPEYFAALEDATVTGKRFVGVPEESSSWLPQFDE